MYLTQIYIFTGRESRMSVSSSYSDPSNEEVCSDL